MRKGTLSKDDRLSIKKTPVLINVQISASYLARRFNLIDELSISDTFYYSGYTYLLKQHDVIKETKLATAIRGNTKRNGKH